MSEALAQAMETLEDILSLPKGENEDYINIGIRIAMNCIDIERNTKKIEDMNAAIQLIEQEYNNISQEKQSL